MGAALTAGFSVSSSRSVVSVERHGPCTGMVENPAIAAIALRSVLHVSGYARLAAGPVVIVSVIRRPAHRVVSCATVKGVSVMPIESPMRPPPSKTAEPTDSEADSEREIWPAKPNSRIWVPERPRSDRVSVNHPGVIRRNVNHIGTGRLNDDGRALVGYGLLLCGLEIAIFLCLLAHYLHGTHHILLLVVVGVAQR